MLSRTFLLITILAIYTGSQPLSAIDLGRFGAKKSDDQDADNKKNDKAAAIEDALKLVNAMNDAATGTITSYEPGHGPQKTEAVTCDEIMAKSLVKANEETAAVIAEKTAVVRAAALLSDRIDELSEKLEEAYDGRAAAELALSDLEQSIQSKLDAAAKEADERIAEANDVASEELERMKLNMNTLKNATAVKIERVEKVAHEQLQAKDDEVNIVREESREEIKKIQIETEEVKVKMLMLHQEDTKALRQEAAEKEKAHEHEMNEVKAAAESKIATIEKEADRMMKEIGVSADAAMASEREKHEETLRKLDEAINEAKEKESEMSSNIVELTTASTSLQSEVSFWKDTHNSQGYCNTTLIREDSRKLVLNALANTKNGLTGTQKLLSNGLGGQVQFVQDKSANVVLFIEEELIPKVEKAMGEACEIALEAYNDLSSKALVLYNDHLAVVVNEKIVPVLDEHVYPVWKKKAVPLIDQCTEQVSPIVKTIDKETRKKVTKARAGIAPRLESWASSFMKYAQKNNFSDKMPKYVSSQLTRAAEDGQWALDSFVYGYLLLVVVLFRSMIFRVIWFFCPLRLFFRKEKPAKKKIISKQVSAKKAVKAERNGTAKNGGKAKVY